MGALQFPGSCQEPETRETNLEFLLAGSQEGPGVILAQWRKPSSDFNTRETFSSFVCVHAREKARANYGPGAICGRLSFFFNAKSCSFYSLLIIILINRFQFQFLHILIYIFSPKRLCQISERIPPPNSRSLPTPAPEAERNQLPLVGFQMAFQSVTGTLDPEPPATNQECFLFFSLNTVKLSASAI